MGSVGIVGGLERSERTGFGEKKRQGRDACCCDFVSRDEGGRAVPRARNEWSETG